MQFARWGRQRRGEGGESKTLMEEFGSGDGSQLGSPSRGGSSPMPTYYLPRVPARQ